MSSPDKFDDIAPEVVNELCQFGEFEFVSPAIEIIAMHLRLARAEAIDECAKVAEEKARQFLSPRYATNQPHSSFGERFACGEVAKAIRAITSAHKGGE